MSDIGRPPLQLSPADIVRRFATLAAACLDQMRRDRLWVYGPPRDVPDLGTSSPRVRSGRVGTLGEFALHGFGCRFQPDSGEVVEVDWDQGGYAKFDAWRFQKFAASLGVSNVDLELMRDAAIAEPTLRDLDGDWFTWVDLRNAIAPPLETP